MKNLFLTFIISVLSFNVQSQSAREYLSPVSSPQGSVTQNVGMTKYQFTIPLPE